MAVLRTTADWVKALPGRRAPGIAAAVEVFEHLARVLHRRAARRGRPPLVLPASRPRVSETGRAVPASAGLAEVDLVGVLGQPQLEELVQAVEEGSAGGGEFVGGS